MCICLREERGKLLAPRLAACNVVGPTLGVVDHLVYVEYSSASALCGREKEIKVLDTLNQTRHRSDRTAIKASGKGSILRVTLLLMWMYLTED